MKFYWILGGVIAFVVAFLWWMGKRETRRLDFDAPNMPKSAHAPSPAKDFADAPEPPEPGMNYGKKGATQHGKKG